MFKKIALGILAAVAALLIYAAVKPADYVIHREVAIQAPAEKIFPYINSSRRTAAWMPWAEMDPQMKMTHSGPNEGVGSKTSWESPGKMGVGSSTIRRVVPNELVEYHLEYVKPFKMQQLSHIYIRPSGGKNIVNWAVTGRNGYVGRLMCIFMDMDKMVGPSFEQGLGKLKTMVEGGG